jgi:ribosomal protein L17
MEDLPKSETELIALAEKLITLMTDNPQFAGESVSADELRQRLDAFIAARKADAMVEAALVQATIAKEQAFRKLFDAMGDRPSETDSGSSKQSMLWN